jgi:hypothetical protein
MNGKQYLSADKGIRSAGDPHLALSSIAAPAEVESRIPENASDGRKVL